MNRQNFGAALFVVALSLLAFVAFAGGNAPPPYGPGDVPTATVNSLGNAGRTEGFIGVATTTAADVLSNAAGGDMITYGGVALAAEMGRVEVYPYLRQVVVTLVEDPAASTGAVCARLGPASDGAASVITNPDGAPVMSCPNVGTAGYTGGCYLTALNQSCTFMVRPKISGCTDYASCHIPIWLEQSAAAVGLSVNVAMIW